MYYFKITHIYLWRNNKINLFTQALDRQPSWFSFCENPNPSFKSVVPFYLFSYGCLIF